MMRFIVPIVLVGLSVAVFFVFTNPLYDSNDPISPGIVTLRAQVASYDEALNNSKALEKARDELTAKLNSINPDNLIKLQKLLPDNIDNIRLILEIEQIALLHGMVLKDIKYNASADKDTKDATLSADGSIQGGGVAELTRKDYGVWDLGFSTVGAYNNFLNFTRDLQSNLRIVDISSIQFSSSTDTRLNSFSAEAYKYDFKIKTYWLKN